MAGKMNYMFSVPNLPKPIYIRLRDIARELDISHQQMVVLGVLAIRKLSSIDEPALDDLVRKVRGIDALGLGEDDSA